MQIVMITKEPVQFKTLANPAPHNTMGLHPDVWIIDRELTREQREMIAEAASLDGAKVIHL